MECFVDCHYWILIPKPRIISVGTKFEADACSHICMPSNNGTVCLCPNGKVDQKMCKGMPCIFCHDVCGFEQDSTSVRKLTFSSTCDQYCKDMINIIHK